MKRILGLLLLLISSLVFAAPAAYVHALDGEAQASTNNVSRSLQIGSLLEQGDEVTVSKGLITLKFEDGQIVALQQGARFKIVNYSYNKTKVADSNVVLSLLSGGMRFVTGVIGGTNRNAIRLQAGTATIGIRGTDIITFVDSSGNVLATVQDGSITFGNAGVTATLIPGQGSTAQANAAPGSGTPVAGIQTVRNVTPLGLIITPANKPVNVTVSANLVVAIAAVNKAADDLRAAKTPEQIEAARRAVATAVAAATIRAREEAIASEQAKFVAIQGGAPATAGTSTPLQGTGVGTTSTTTTDPAVTITVTSTTTSTETTDTTLAPIQTTIPCTSGVSGC